MGTIRRVRTVFSGVAGSPYYNNMYFTLVNGSASAVIAAVDTFWESFDSTCITALTWDVLGDTELVDEATGSLVGVESGTALSGASNGGTTPLPFATQLCINTFTGTFVGGRQLRGKIFIPALASITNVAGDPAPATITAANTAINTLVSNTSGPGPLRVYSPTHGTSAVVTSGSTFSRFAVMRSRRD